MVVGNNKNVIQIVHTRKGIVLLSIVCIEIVDKGEVARTSNECDWPSIPKFRFDIGNGLVSDVVYCYGLLPWNSEEVILNVISKSNIEVMLGPVVYLYNHIEWDR